MQGQIRGVDPAPIAADKARRLQKLDGLIGPPLCAMLTALTFFRQQPPRDARPASIAFFKLGEQGSTVLAIPAIREAVRRVGAENTYFVVFAENRKILDILALLPPGNVLDIRTSSIGSFLRSVLAACLKLRRIGLDAAIDLDFFARSTALLVGLSGARWRVGLHSYFGEGPYRGNLMTHRPRYNPHLHTSRLFLALVNALDQDPGEFPAWRTPGEMPASEMVSISPKERVAVENVLRDRLRVTGPLPPILLLNANCSDMIPLRRWASERFVELAKRFLDAYPSAAVVFTGAPVEQAQADALAESVGSARSVSLAGRTTLGELFALYDLSVALVTNDSGPAHFASLTRITVIALFGPETPALFGPLSPTSVSLTAGLPCSPCVSAQNNRLSACTNNLCMQSILADQVFGEVQKAFARVTV